MRKGGTVGLAILLLILVIAAGLWLFFRERDAARLIGTWKTGPYEVQFRSDGTFEDVGSHAHPSDGEYSLDASQTPTWITIVPRRNLAGPELPPLYYLVGRPAAPLVRGLLRFKTRNEMELIFTTAYAHPNAPWATSGLGEERPSSFQPTDGTVILTLTRIRSNE